MVAAKVGQVNGLFLSIFATNTILFIGYEEEMNPLARAWGLGLGG